MQHHTASPTEAVMVLNHFFLPLTPTHITGARIILYLCFAAGSDTAQCRRSVGFHRPPLSQSFLWHVQTRSHLQATERKKISPVSRDGWQRRGELGAPRQSRQVWPASTAPSPGALPGDTRSDWGLLPLMISLILYCPHQETSPRGANRDVNVRRCSLAPGMYFTDVSRCIYEENL